jgi:Undecaprenyl-phosphate galactose phosphotransferase WbaP
MRLRFLKSLLSRAGILPSHLTANISASLSPDLAEAREGTKPRVEPRYAGALGHATKRAFDVSAALTLLILLSPLMLTVALLVMRDGGACVYGHTRVGMDGRKFRCLKFRSMVRNADAVLQALLASDPAARAEWEKDFKLRNDVRVTRLGRFIRKTSIDELPQLWNVVRGDMSLVGPRPVVEKELERYGDSVSYYLRVLPGITGLWQVSGRNDADYDKRVMLDVAYVRNWTFAGDIVILFKTIGVVIYGRGAY